MRVWFALACRLSRAVKRCVTRMQVFEPTVRAVPRDGVPEGRFDRAKSDPEFPLAFVVVEVRAVAFALHEPHARQAEERGLSAHARPKLVGRRESIEHRKGHIKARPGYARDLLQDTEEFAHGHMASRGEITLTSAAVQSS